jgi:hypothetical protein
VNQILGQSLPADELRALVQKAMDGATRLARNAAVPIGAAQAPFFEAVFGVPPSWHPTGASWVLGGVVRKRMELAVNLLSGGSLWVYCFGYDLQPDTPETYFVRAAGERYRIGLGVPFWEAIRDGDMESAESGLLAAALRIAFGDLIGFKPGAAPKNLAYCYARYALHLSGRKIPGWVAKGCAIPPDRWHRVMPAPSQVPSSGAPPSPSPVPVRPIPRLSDEDLERILGFKPADPLSARIDWVISQVPPTQAARPPLKDLVRKKFDEGLNDVMSKVGVPKKLRPYVTKAAHGALERGSKVVLKEGLNQLDITSSEVVEAVGGFIDQTLSLSP